MTVTSRRRPPFGLLALSATLLLAGCGGSDRGSDDDGAEVTEATAPPAQNDTRGTFADPLFDARDSVADQANEMTEERKGDLDSAIEASEGTSGQ